VKVAKGACREIAAAVRGQTRRVRTTKPPQGCAKPNPTHKPRQMRCEACCFTTGRGSCEAAIGNPQEMIVPQSKPEIIVDLDTQTDPPLKAETYLSRLKPNTSFHEALDCRPSFFSSSSRQRAKAARVVHGEMYGAELTGGNAD
jgi:hypothetical protein